MSHISGAIPVTTINELRRSVGREAVSEWHPVTQGAINKFAEATGDFNPLHVDPEFAAKTPFGGTIAHGYYALSLAPIGQTLSGLWTSCDPLIRKVKTGEYAMRRCGK